MVQNFFFTYFSIEERVETIILWRTPRENVNGVKLVKLIERKKAFVPNFKVRHVLIN